MRRILTISIITSIALSLWGCGQKETVPEEEIVRIPVELSRVERGSIESTIQFFGNVAADQEIRVYSTIPNRIIAIKVEIGDTVQAGDLLAQIDTEKIRQAVTQAEAGLESAQAQFVSVAAEFKRIEKLYNDNALSQSQYEAVKAQRDAARSGVKQVRAVLSTAKSQLADTRITAPIAGIVSERNFEVGDMAPPQFPLFTVVKMEPVLVQINVIERHIDIVKPGQKAWITVSGYPDTVFQGWIRQVNPTLNPMTRTAKAEIEVPNPDLLLRPGMFADVSVVIDEKTAVPIIPKYTIIEKTSLNYEAGQLTTSKVKINRHVFVVEDSLAIRRDITIGIEDRIKAEIISGLQGGEKIVVIGQHNLTDSCRVAIIRDAE
ncbi:MAG: efflux RND transporter periplasmic adaptor subunit [Candidatus Marinimicrobia bacterium]|nr:efflux RND transporter periplasmic adaptor subunit [Candidatus Neomarinimicrobiota bacterium]